MRINRVLLILAFVALPAHAQPPESSTVRIGVLSLFHPKTLILASTQPLTLALDAQTVTLPPNRPATHVLTASGFTVAAEGQPAISTQTLSTPESTFTLAVPGKLTRLYRGALTITGGTSLVPVVAIPTELAVASIVQAESPPHASFEALKAQAVVSRSFLLANRSGHPSFDACDTTHCQFLRSPPPLHSPAAVATRATRNQVLLWQATPESLPQIVAAMYSRECGGHTRAHPTAPDRYPFYSVRCDFCLRHPSAGPLEGHGIGLCQLGANGMAACGTPYPRILAHYFPNTTLSTLD